MISTIAGVFGLLVAGFVFGRVSTAWVRPARATDGRIKAGIVLAIVAFPVATLMLAKLFNSDVLGWVFGLSLIAGAALLPCAAIFYLGLRLGSRSARGNASIPDAAANMEVQVERGSVHASDDAPSKRLSVSPNTTLRAMVELAIADSYLPNISGGNATWIVESSGAGAGAGAGASTALRPIAVIAQQWAEVKLLVAADVSIAAHFGATLPRLNVRYRCQEDPDAIVAALEAADR
ncbi:MAG: hypothetical protein ABI671_16200 [Burkholderiales bacterium]